jgi:hypothetical protein
VGDTISVGREEKGKLLTDQFEKINKFVHFEALKIDGFIRIVPFVFFPFSLSLSLMEKNKLINY